MSLPGNEVRFLGCSVFSLVAILTVDQFSHVEVGHPPSWKQLKIPSLNTKTCYLNLSLETQQLKTWGGGE